MSSLKPFQLKTVEWALARLRDPAGSRRVLIADEVGLGKTLVAQGILGGLAGRGKHLNVFYVCSSLSIGHQNRESLLEMLPEQDRAAARVEVDRLTLLPEKTPPRTGPLTLFTLTPGTMPLNGRTGRVDERALLARILKEFPDLRKNARIVTALRNNVNEYGWARALEAAQVALPELPAPLLKSFRRALAELLQRREGARTATLHDALAALFEAQPKEAIRDLRVALSTAALDSLAPDVLIFDEFQKFFEVVNPDDSDLDQTAHGLLRRLLRVDESNTAHRPAVVLLSATPFRMYGTAESGEQGAHQKDLFTLLRFLFGDAASEKVPELQRDFAEYGRLLRVARTEDPAVFEVRDRLQASLSSVMARTERSDLFEQAVRSTPEIVRTPLEPHDIRLFRHMRDSAQPQHRFMAPAYWTSIPYALQTMEQSGYAFRSQALDVPVPREARAIAIHKSHVRRYEPLEHPHPRLRQLLCDVPPTVLSLPWLPPTLPWWKLREAFARAEAAAGPEGLTKTLVFSRFVAVPRAIASVLSYEAELAAFGRAAQGRGARTFDYTARGSSHGGGEAASNKVGEHQPRPAFSPTLTKGLDTALATVLDFLPFPALAAAGDPLAWIEANGAPADPATVLKSIEERLAAILGRGGAGGSRRPLWHWVQLLERKARTWTALVAGLRKWLEDSPEGRGTARKLVDAFVTRVEEPSSPPTDQELRQLAELALLGPGNVLYRAVERVFGAMEKPAPRIKGVVGVAYDCLRGYLDSPEFHQILPGKTHRASVRQAVWDGNLESVLDEYLTLQAGLADNEIPAGREARAFGALESALGIRTSSIDLNELGKPGKFKLRCHAALPFGLSKADVLSSTGRLRNDFLRVAFNSPFRPFVLASTSIGQEGLDFHTYCRQIVHWDLPSNPVDLEQRDGRVRRFGGLAVRRVLARVPPNIEAGRSPWRGIGASQREEAGGLKPWWGCEGAEIRRLVYMPDFSRQEGDLAARLAELSLYRMTIGQADQEQLVRALQRRLEGSEQERADVLDWLRKCRLRLSPFFRDAGVPLPAERRA